MKKEKIHGWLARDKNGGLRLWRPKPYRETNLEYGESWGLPCEMGAWIRLDESLFPEVKWSDEEPTRVELEISIV